MRPMMLLLFAVLGACATQDVDDASYTARFPAFPSELFSAFENTCTDPAQDFRRLSRTEAECREYLEPESTASIILTYDGTTADLPRQVIRFRTWADGSEYLLQTETYLHVPQKSGPPLRVHYPSARFARTLDKLYRKTGGMPEKSAVLSVEPKIPKVG